MATIRVKTDCRTIGEAVRAAAPGDTILVERGVYRETVTIGKSCLRVAGEGLVVIDGGFERDYGIVLENAAGVRLESLNITDCLKNGVYIDRGADHTLAFCRTDNCGESGVRIFGAEGVRLLCCAAGGNGQSGVELEETGGILLDRCLFKSNGFCGAEGRQTQGVTEVIGCEIRANVTAGCAFTGGFPVRLVNNCVADNLSDGCTLTNPLSEILNNVVAGNRGGGIFARARGCAFRANRIYDQRETGLTVTDGCVIVGNHFTDNGDYGLLITGTDNEVRANFFMGNKEADIRRLKPRNFFSGNDFSTSLPYELKCWQS